MSPKNAAARTETAGIKMKVWMQYEMLSNRGN